MKEEAEPTKCKNCGTIYSLKKGAPEICWVCGLPTDEEVKSQLKKNEV